jgi:RNA polymerase sigma-70 factor (ECF subfamily)
MTTMSVTMTTLRTTSAAQEGAGAHPEAALVQRLIARDGAAYHELFRTHAADVHRLAMRFVQGEAEADEIVQEVFIAAYRYIERFRGDSRLKTWLYRITVNRALKRQRWWRRRREVGSDALPDLVEHQANQATRVEDAQQLALVRRCLDRLEARKRAVLVLHEIEGLDTREIALIVDCPRSTVLTRLARARADLVRLAREAGIDVPGQGGT